MKNIVAFDIETTGLDKSKDQIIQLACVKFNPETYEIIDKFNTYIQPVGNYSISVSAYFKHGIKPDFLKDKPHFYEVCDKIVKFFDGCDVLSYNGNRFDLTFLQTELEKCGMSIDFLSKKCYDAFVEEKNRNGNTLGETYKRYAGKTMVESGLQAHNAYSDVLATIYIFKEQQKIKAYEPENMYGEDSVIVDKMFNDELVPCFNIGKYNGVSVQAIASIDRNYLNWALSDKCTFAKTTKNFIRNFLVEFDKTNANNYIK